MKFRQWARLILLVLIAGCASHQGTSPTADASASPAAAETSAGPEAKIHVSYAHPGDYLSSLAVTKYSGAQPLKTIPTKDGDAITARFDGGVTVWQVGVEKGLLAGVPMIGTEAQRYAPAEVKYGELPPHFVASIPDSGPPEPLESDHYYVFAATRGSGSTSYEAVKVNGDGSLEAFDADPRAGTSYWLCCNLPADFAVTAPPQ
ncbi:MAG TPA: hypothetical protein VN742_03370 [Candidatus Binataceae bacterium]|nr:hypothetical protein [Candidatus Binataceae bacterium]